MIPITNRINKFILTKSFPDELKVADVTPVFTKDDANNKTNFRPISLLPMISKIFERVLLDQIEKFAEKYLIIKIVWFYKSPFYTIRPFISTEKLTKNFRKVWCYRNGSDGTMQRIRLSSTWSLYSQTGCLWFWRLRNIFNIWLPF